jgi:superfamily II DNA or RNA helicase
MALLADLTVGCKVEGLSPTGPVTIKSVESYGADAVNVIFQETDGSIHQQVVLTSDAASLKVLDAASALVFDGDGAMLRLAAEARRIQLAYLFDPYLAVHTSRIQPLPHQISAVYGVMLARHPLRFLLADDPGAGKTIMAGLLIKELMIRGDVERCLIVAPGGLVEQWQDELYEKFKLNFELLTRDMIESSRTGNPLEERNFLIGRLDMLARNEDLIARLKASTEWDLIVCDEAHKMSASRYSNKVERTKRYLLGEALGEKTRHLLLMTATPHNGKQDAFELFMSLIDKDRFEGVRQGGHSPPDVSDLMRRMVKEELVTFEGNKLFPERRAYTRAYHLSPAESNLYDAVTDYVCEQMGRADLVGEADKRRRLNVGFALQTLQRRLASSPLAIFRSLQRRRERLEQRLTEEKRLHHGRKDRLTLDPRLEATVDTFWEDIDDAPEVELEEREEQVVDQATAAQTIEELEAEIATLRVLERQAKAVLHADSDTKWRELSDILELAEMRDADGNRRKLIIFTEPRDTVSYLTKKISAQLGRPEAVVVIHGGVSRDARRKIVEDFRNDRDVLVMVANDAACEGINLQRAHLMINYDLPWNPNKLEQRFGRIHRIGQTEVCHVWNLVATDTREGDVYHRLLEKLAAERIALQGRVYDVLGQLFDQRPLRELMVEAIRYGQQPEVKAQLFQQVDNAFDREHINSLLENRALARDTLSLADRLRIREEMERAETRRLQPGYIREFFLDAFQGLGGRVHKREEGRWEITRVPASVHHHDKVTGLGKPVARKYERICFERAFENEHPVAEYITPGHPLLDAVIGKTLEKYRRMLMQGAVMVDPSNKATEPRVLYFMEMTVQDSRRNRHGQPTEISRQLMFLEMFPDGTVRRAGPAPYLDYEPLAPELAGRAESILKADWIRRDHAAEINRYAVGTLLPERLKEVRDYHIPLIDKTEHEVEARLKRALNHWDQRALQLQAQEEAGGKPRVNSTQARQKAEDIAGRLERRRHELALQRSITALPPVLTGGCLVIPRALLEDSGKPGTFTADAAARKAIELAGMDAVMAAEKALGYAPRDVSAEDLGYDIESKHGETGNLRFIEVKGRVKGADTVIVTQNEQRCAFNNPEQWILAIVQVDGDQTELRYVRNCFDHPPALHEAATVCHLNKLWELGTEPM